MRVLAGSNHTDWGPGASLSPGSYRMPNGWDGDWRRVPGPRQCGVCPPGGWASCPGRGVPRYWVWGPGSGTFDYPFAVGVARSAS